ncbi:L-alanine-DL-glutamate epimerase [Halomicrobium zhouii]|uniref:L-alanine-DL-glutamate epimerase n=1 Tax=Halomicrobium zhouii TaxID=767519 RepID=A0A1I6KQF1_9EURY|nr:dipeptide epimerase [Halomicrobium zhouii]SFR93140.1 L-alanine-DL-glutamate epimerase [Halomicrobium zhouii]
MDTTFHHHELPVEDPFTIARGTTGTADAFVVRLEREGVVGVGGGTPSAYYGESPDSVADVLPGLLAIVEDVDDPHAGQRVADRLFQRAPDAPAARAAVSSALADLAARDLEVPLYRQWGLDPEVTPSTSYTVGIAEPGEMAHRAEAAVEAGFDHLKVKLGTDDDRARFDAVREAAPDAEIRVDANEGWDADEAIEKAEWLAAAGVEFLEQPVPASDLDGLRTVAAEASLPVCADEACVTASDVPRVADACDLVTVKLMKCGGLQPALEQIHTARAHGLEVMLGCMVESNASIAPAVHLAPLVDYADLDGALLLAEDVCDGIPVQDGAFDLSAVASGTGARLVD